MTQEERQRYINQMMGQQAAQSAAYGQSLGGLGGLCNTPVFTGVVTAVMPNVYSSPQEDNILLLIEDEENGIETV